MPRLLFGLRKYMDVTIVRSVSADPRSRLHMKLVEAAMRASMRAKASARARKARRAIRALQAEIKLCPEE